MMHSKQFMKTGFNNQNVQISEFQNYLQIKCNLSISFCQSLMKKQKHFALGCPVCDKTPILPPALQKNIHFI